MGLIVKSKMSDQVRRLLREGIVKGEIAEGTRLVEVDIAARLGVSRTPVREALWQLCGMDLVHRLEHGGYEVGNVRRELVDILDIRAALECHAARRAAVVITDEQVADMLSICERMEALAVEQFERRAALNRSFHSAIIEASGNRPLSRLVDGYYEYFEVAQPLYDRKQIEKTQREHREILESLASRDPDRAANVVGKHITAAASFIAGGTKGDAAWKASSSAA
jgi:DNA-binding GntR family transcriptional regulator